MLFNASIFIETKPKSSFCGLIKSKPITVKLSDWVIDAVDRNEGERKLSKEVERYKELDHKFFSDKTIQTFLLPVK